MPGSQRGALTQIQVSESAVAINPAAVRRLLFDSDHRKAL
jgi:hypothetical protein